MRIETEALCEDAVPGYTEEGFSYAANNELMALFEREIQRLPERQATVIRERFMGARPVEPPSYRRLGWEMGCSHEHVRKLEARGLENLRESLGFLEKEFDAPEDRGRRSEVGRQRLARDCVTGGKSNRLSREQYDNMTPEQRKARKQENGHRSYLKHRERKLAENKQRYEENKAYLYWQTKNMSDDYIAHLLSSGNSFTKQDIPKELIELKRIHLKLERSLEQKGKS